LKTIALVLAALSFASLAHAKEKKAVVCAAWLPYATMRTDVKDAPKMWLCTDNPEKPYAMINVQLVTRKDKDGNTVNLAVGDKI
jgi:hypothetical protein